MVLKDNDALLIIASMINSGILLVFNKHITS